MAESVGTVETGASTAGNWQLPTIGPPSRPKPNRPEPYDGTRDITVIKAFVMALESYFIICKIEPPYVFYYLPTFLKKTASNWFYQHYSSIPPEQVTWEGARDRLIKDFSPPNLEEHYWKKWSNLRQKTTVLDYISELYDILSQLPKLPDEAVLHQFIHGLKPQTRYAVEDERPKTLEEAIAFADQYDERVSNRLTARRHFHYGEHQFSQQDTRGEPMQIDALGIRRPLRQRPVRMGGKTPQRITTEDRIHLSSIGACFKCRQLGHMMRECPLARTIPQKSGQSGKGHRQL
jgi:hypothetical protein